MLLLLSPPPVSDILIPGTNTSTDSGATQNKIPAGEKVLVIKTPKGVYIRTGQGKIFAVRTAPKTGGAVGGAAAPALAKKPVGSTTIQTTTTATVTSAAAGSAASAAGNRARALCYIL